MPSAGILMRQSIARSNVYGRPSNRRLPGAFHPEARSTNHEHHKEGSLAVTRTPEDTQARSEVMRELARRIQGEYIEMPGLSITLGQAQRLLAIDETTCTAVFRTLVTRGVLRRTSEGQYVRA